MDIKSLKLGGSKFAIGLAELFQEIADRKNTKTKTSERIAEATKTANKLKPKFNKLILDHTGISPKNISFGTKADFGIYVMMLLGDDLKTAKEKWKKNKTINDFKKNRYWPLTIANHAYGNDIAQMFVPDDYNKSELKDLKKLSDSYDKRMAKLKPDTMFKGHPVSALITFDLGSTLLAAECIGKKAPVIDPMECAAILIHELGHVLALCKLAADEYFKMSHFNGVIEYITTTDKLTEAERIEILAANMKDNTAIAALDSLVRDKEGASTLSKILVTISSFIVEALFSPIIIIGTLVNLIGNILTRPFHKLFTNTGRGHKIGDVAKSNYNNYFQEWDADAFTAQHGVGSYTISGLKKITESSTMMMAIDKVDTMGDYMYAKTLFWLTMAPVIMMTHQEEDTEEHGSLQERALNIMKKDIAMLKDNNLTQDELDLIVTDYYRAEALYKNIDFFGDHVSSLMSGAKWIFNTLARLVTTPLGLDSLRDSINTANELKQTYTELVNNPLFVNVVEQRKKIKE